MRNTKYFLLIIMISLFGFMNLNGQATDLFISEYIEGSGTYNKALELFNGTGSSVNLDTYSISIYTNGSSSASYTLALSGDLANNDVLVISRASADAQIQEVTDIEDASLNNFNGDDAIALLNNGIVIDVFGTIGVDPGSSWPLPGIGNNTKDHTLVRKSSVSSPNSTNSASFGTTTENSEWDVYEQNTFSFIGSHTFGATGNLAPVISNIVIDPETNIDYLETVSVSADVTDDDTVSSVVLNWGTTSGSLTNQITMNNSGSTYTTLSDIPAQAKSTTVYYQITATDNDSATSTSTEASYTVLSNVLPIITNIGQTPTANITSSTAVSISADITDNDGTIIGAELHWGTSTGTLSNTIDMSPSSGDTYVTDSEIPVQLNGTTVYYEIYALDNDSGETTSSEQSYEVLDPLPLDADFSANSTNVYVDQEVTFTNATSGGSIPYSFSWNFGDSNTSTTENPTHTYGSTGTYTVELTVTDANSASDTETKLGYITVEEAPEGATDLFFSEYIEGSSNNKAIEIFNGTGAPVSLSDYSLKQYNNGATDLSGTTYEVTLSGTLANNDVYVVYNSNAGSNITSVGDQSGASVTNFNGDDAIALIKNDVVIDVIGEIGNDPGTAWPVAGTSNATAEHTLVRKSSIASPTADWAVSAGTTAENSQWIVYDQDETSYLGAHVFTYDVPTEFSVNFEADLTSGDQPLTVNFTSSVSGGTSPYLYSWDFDGDEEEDSTSDNPSYTFTEAGTYTVSLYVIDDEARDSLHVKTGYITVNSTSIESYYASITETSGQALKTQLHNLIATNTLTNYDASREAMYSTIDNINGKVTGVYSGLEVAHTYGTTSTPAGIDCEHSYPQSWLEAYESASDYAIARTDIHHLFPTKSEVNSSRGNLPFDNVNSVLNSWSEASGYVSYRGTNIDGETVFEVADQHKGNTARAMLYMNTRWNLPLSDDGSTTGLNIDMLPTLLQWHEADPVDQAEIDRNEGIYDYQGNRNPFVNHPEWVTAIYGSATNPQVATPTISPASGSFVNSVEVAISCLTNGASIYYTTNGDTPTTSSTLYENPFAITESATIKAIASKVGFDDSGIATATYTLSENQSVASDLFISEYIEGASGSNKALEIFNGTGSDVDLSAYSVKLGNNGTSWDSPISLTGTLTNNSVYVIANSSAEDTGIIEAANLSNGSLSFNGNDAVGLFKNDVLIDIIGIYENDPGAAWDVAGTTEATEDHVLVRKSYVSQGNTDWTTSAGTDASDSEWLVYANATYDYLGNHSFTPLTVDFSADLTSTTAGTTIQFTANVSGGSSPYVYEWDFNNDGVAESMSANPNHIYNVAGTYSVSLYVLDNNFDERTLVKNDYITIASNIVYADDLIISEYVAGSGNNKSLEVYNGTGQTVDLSNYSIRISNPGGSWAQTLNLSGNLENDAVYVLAHPSASASVLNLASTTNASLAFNGKNAIGLFKSDSPIDIIGVANASPAGNADGWTVANIANATASRTLVRKSSIRAGNTNSETWTSGGTKNGTTTPDSEWTVFEQDSFGDLGNHDFDFGDETLPVTLTSFTSSMTYSGLGQAMVSIQWKTEAESGLIGYNVLRSMNPFYESAIRVNQEIVSANNSLVGNSYSYIDQNVQLHNNYYYWLESVELSNENETFGPIHIKVVGYNSDSVTVPYKTSLRSIYPNPFNPSTTVRFYVNTTDRVNIKVYNIRGQEIKQLTQEVYQPGFYKVIWNGKDENENRCASGIYLFKMETTRESQLIKGILVK